MEDRNAQAQGDGIVAGGADGDRRLGAGARGRAELANRGVVSGCGGGNYCPTASVTREQMGVFISATFSLALYGI